MDRNSATASTSRIGTAEKVTDVRISACIEVGETSRHFEVHAATFDDAYADLTRRLKRAGYRIAERVEIAGTAR